MSQHFPLIALPAPIAHVCDVDDVGDTDDSLGGKSESNSDTEDRRLGLALPYLLMRGVDWLAYSGHA